MQKGAECFEILLIFRGGIVLQLPDGDDRRLLCIIGVAGRSRARNPVLAGRVGVFQRRPRLRTEVGFRICLIHLIQLVLQGGLDSCGVRGCRDMHPDRRAAVDAVVGTLRPFIGVVWLVADLVFCQVVGLQEIPTLAVNCQACATVGIGHDCCAVRRQLGCRDLPAALRLRFTEEQRHTECRRFAACVRAQIGIGFLDRDVKGFAGFSGDVRVRFEIRLLYRVKVLPRYSFNRSQRCA